ncbi:hypothetical protein ACIGMX_39915 [Streptomyces aquilus]|uniref:Uncharacterized protein n=1 Tax=Streptomyces aquilus TaxID=2548456 RepID=A0A3Q9BVN7_9ACTN|nr:hypothetical protein [Streptomyces aquilus]AZP15571.1 hypothetical protein EJC51_05335 [Streptomyces aquilus]
MTTEFTGVIECRPLARIWGVEDEDAVWQAAIDLDLLNTGNAYDALACLFGVRNSFGFRPLAEGRGLPEDASEGLRKRLAGWGGPASAWGTTWITWAELRAADWDETDRSGGKSRRAVAGATTHWGPVWDVMRALGRVHGAEHVRLVVWFD